VNCELGEARCKAAVIAQRKIAHSSAWPAEEWAFFAFGRLKYPYT
jgi:hypothetical protein